MLEGDGFELPVPGREPVRRGTGLKSRKRERICSGTEGSNPSPSSGESRANLISSIRALKFAKRDGVTRRYAAWFGGSWRRQRRMRGSSALPAFSISSKRKGRFLEDLHRRRSDRTSTAPDRTPGRAAAGVAQRLVAGAADPALPARRRVQDQDAKPRHSIPRKQSLIKPTPSHATFCLGGDAGAKNLRPS